MVERQAKAVAGVLLNFELLGAIGADFLAGFGSGEFGRRAVLVGCADVEHFVALQPAEARMHIGRQHRAGKIAQMLDAVDVGKRGGDQVSGHWPAT